MAKFCDACGDPIGTRELIHDHVSCDRCRAEATKPQKIKSGILQFVAELDARSPLRGTGRLDLPGGEGK